MKLLPLLVASLLPIGLSASPIANADDLQSRNPGNDVLSPRADGVCRIVNAPSGVNCRSGPGTGYSVVKSLDNGFLCWYKCYKSGECITMNGVKNCGWHYAATRDWSCYVNGHFTDNNCSASKLPKC
ncbi:hypothetical protein B0I37DRAFT_40163 [Chaetomium sp. MPI-CAGE-AT-0009]|nr:hypothetical protein B0I37DRAFT_40163 [Chaetomium sp. MPI-CAGE-AT-0009]